MRRRLRLRTIDLLREQIPGTWTYDPQTYTWNREEGGWAVWYSTGYDEYTERSTGSCLRYHPADGTADVAVARRWRGTLWMERESPQGDRPSH